MILAFRPARLEDLAYCERLYFAGMARSIDELKLDKAAHAASFRQQWQVNEVRIITGDGADIGWLPTRRRRPRVETYSAAAMVGGAARNKSISRRTEPKSSSRSITAMTSAIRASGRIPCA